MNIKTTKLSKISNIIFCGTISFCLFFLWCNYYTKNIRISFFSAIIAMLATIIIATLITIKLVKNSKLQSDSDNAYNNFRIRFSYSKIRSKLLLLKNIINFSSYKKISDYHYLIDKSSDLYFFEDSDTNIDYLQILQTHNTNNIIIVCSKISSCELDCSDINLTYFETKKIYDLLKSTQNEQLINKYLDNIKLKNKPKYRLKDIICIVLNKQKSKSYFWLGFVLLFSSLFTPFSNYYIIVATIMFLLAIISRFSNLFLKKQG